MLFTLTYQFKKVNALSYLRCPVPFTLNLYSEPGIVLDNGKIQTNQSISYCDSLVAS